MDPTLDYSEIPSQPPPPGITPNFVDPVTNGQITTIVISILLPLMLAIVVLRVYGCLWVNRRFAKSDCKYDSSIVMGSLLMTTRRLPSCCGMRIKLSSNTDHSSFVILDGIDLIHFCHLSWYICPYPQHVTPAN